MSPGTFITIIAETYLNLGGGKAHRHWVLVRRAMWLAFLAMVIIAIFTA